MSKIKLIEDLVIPAGTTFDNCDDLKVEFISDNYEATMATGKDGTINIFLNRDVVIDNPEKFKIIND